MRYSKKARNFFCFKFVLQWGQIIFSSRMDSSSGFEHAGHINPSKAMLISLNQGRKVIFGSYMIQEILIQNHNKSAYIVEISAFSGSPKLFPRLFFIVSMVWKNLSNSVILSVPHWKGGIYLG